jgi:tetratricopeptide (TPR) repeat protein
MKKDYLSGFLILFIMIIILSASFIVTGCGPTKEEIMAWQQAQEQQRIAAEAEHARVVEEARKQKQMEEARLAKILATERAGDEAARQGELEKALDNYQEVLKNVQRYSEQDQRVRQSVIKVVRAMHVPPATPESVMRSMVRAETKLKMGGIGIYEVAAKEMEQAVLDGPWIADAYFNLGTVQEKAGKFNEAMQNFKLYLLANPRSQDAAAIHAKIYELEVMKEDQEKMQAMDGEWKDENSGAIATLKIEGSTIRISGSWNFEVQRRGHNLEGFISYNGHTDSVGPEGIPCTTPGQTNPISGVISDDCRSVEFKWMFDVYKTNYDLNDDESYHDYYYKKCTGVVLESKQEGKLRLVKMSAP